jgi:hypothetical protein
VALPSLQGVDFINHRGGGVVTLEEAIARKFHDHYTDRIGYCFHEPGYERCKVDVATYLSLIGSALSDQGGDLLEPTDGGWRAVKANLAVGERRNPAAHYTLTRLEDPS